MTTLNDLNDNTKYPNIAGYLSDELKPIFADFSDAVTNELEQVFNQLESFFIILHRDYSYATARRLLNDISTIFDNAADLTEED